MRFVDTSYWVALRLRRDVNHDVAVRLGGGQGVRVLPGLIRPARAWRVGAKVDDYYEVLKGLKAGERVVTSANFLIDSESRLRAAIQGMGGGM